MFHSGVRDLPWVVLCILPTDGMISRCRQPQLFARPLVTDVPLMVLRLPQAHLNNQRDNFCASLPTRLIAVRRPNSWPRKSLNRGIAQKLSGRTRKRMIRVLKVGRFEKSLRCKIRSQDMNNGKAEE